MAAEISRSVKVIDQSKVAPPPGSVSTTTRNFFYELPHPTLHFTQTILPHLKQSLSLSLLHLTAVKSDANFNHSVANHAREVKALKSLVPKLPLHCLSSSSNTTHVVPIMAIQFAVFPNSGISIGVTLNHAAANGRSFNHFLKFWASMNRGEDLTSLSLPLHNKDLIEDPDRLSSISLQDLRKLENLNTCGDHQVPPDNVLITLVLKQTKIKQLKHWITTADNQQQSKIYSKEIRISTFAVACAFILNDDDDMLYHFLALADCRERFGSKIPATYFGNCVTQIYAPIKRRDLMGANGMVIAAKAIGRQICELGKGSVFKGEEKFQSSIKEIFKDGRVVTVASSPKCRVYETDIRWGKPKKVEMVHINGYSCFSFVESRKEDGGLDIGVVVGRDRLDLFNTIF
ncbi:hypothetical protein ACOSP7_004184 [Xanthoceras sorbifolium]